MVSKMRKQKIADRIRKELSELVLFHASDPRIRGISITDIEVDRELTLANVYVSSIEGRERSAEILAGLNHASGFLRSELAKRVELRITPNLRFHWDPTPEHADHMEQLFKKLESEGKPSEPK